MFYEFVFLARPDLSTSQLEEIIEKVKELLTNFNGSVGKIEYWGLRNLAYKIKKNKKAHYYLLNLTTSHEGLKELQRVFSVNDSILRTLSIKVDSLDETISPLEKSNSEKKYSKENKQDTEPGNIG